MTQEPSDVRVPLLESKASEIVPGPLASGPKPELLKQVPAYLKQALTAAVAVVG